VIFERLRRRLTLINTLALMVMVAVLAGGAFFVTNKLLLEQEQAPLRADALQAAHEYGERGPVSFQFEHGGYQLSGDFYILWDSQGRVIFDPGTISTARLKDSALAVARSHTPTFTEVELPTGDALVYGQLVDYPGPSSGQQQTAVLQVGRSLGSVARSESALISVLAGVALAGLLLSLLTGWVLAGRALVPIELAFERQRQFVAHASHELRTPLAVLDASVQVLLRHPERTVADSADTIDSASAELARMRRLLEDLLTLARADSGRLELELSEVDVDALVARLIDDLRPIADAHSSPISAQPSGVGVMIADPDRLRQLLLILVDNALTHTPPGTEVRIGAERHGRDLALVVADSGPGIPAHARELVMERFRRLEEGRSSAGAGLGLSIALSLAEAMGGRLRLSDNHPGLRAEITLPVSGPEPADA